MDERTGEIHDYTRKGGVLDGLVVLPGGGTMTRADLWNSVEAKHKRGDATVAREFVVALPDELGLQERHALAKDYARELADRYGVAVDVNIHAPGKEGDQRNHHAHILVSACYCSPSGELGKKAVELDPIHCKRAGLANVVEVERERWQDRANVALAKAGQEARIDHRTLEAQGVERMPTTHLGPAAKAIEQRTGMGSEVRLRSSLEQAKSIRAAEDKRNAEQLERVSRRLDKTIVRLASEISAAVSRRVEQAAQAVKAGVADFRAKFEQRKAIEAGMLQARQAFEKNKADMLAMASQKLEALKAAKQPEQQTERPQSRPKRDNGPDFSR